MTATAFERTVRHLAAIEEIKQLKALYCLHCDRHYDPEKLSELFTADAVWDSSGRGRFEGREAIRTFFAGASSIFPWAAHLAMNPVIEIDEALSTARGQWRLMMPATSREEDGRELPIFQVSDYAETYRVEDGHWRIATLRVTHRRLTLEGGAWNER